MAFSDDDSWWRPGALARAVALLEAHPRLALVAARVLVGPEEVTDPTCLQMQRGPIPPDADLPGPPVVGFLACGAVVRRSAFLAVGGFEPRYGIGGEEELLAIDLAAAGWGLIYAGDVVAHHHPARGDGRPGRRRAQVRNALWTAWLRRPPLACGAAEFAAVGGLGGRCGGARGVVRRVAGPAVGGASAACGAGGAGASPPPGGALTPRPNDRRRWCAVVGRGPASPGRRGPKSRYFSRAVSVLPPSSDPGDDPRRCEPDRGDAGASLL